MENPIQITFDVHIRCCGEVWNFNQISSLFFLLLHKILILHVLVVMKKKSKNWKTSESESRTFKIRFVHDLRSHHSCEWDFRYFRCVIKNMENSWKQWNCCPGISSVFFALTCVYDIEYRRAKPKHTSKFLRGTHQTEWKTRVSPVSYDTFHISVLSCWIFFCVVYFYE